MSTSTEKQLPVAEPEHTHTVDEKSDTFSEPQSGEDANIDKKALLRRIDFHVLPILVVVYLFAFLDRVNIGNASVFGMATELKLVGNQFNVALCIFFIPYIVFEVSRPINRTSLYTPAELG